MRRNQIVTACFLAGVLAAAPAVARAQAKNTAGTFTAAAEFGVRAYTTEPKDVDKGKLEEYRALPSGALIERATFQYIPKDQFGTYQLTLRRPGQLDQSMWLQASRPGLYDFNIRYDRIPHLYSSTARSPGNEGATTPGVNSLPTPRPDSLAWRNAPYIGNIRTVWSPIKATFAYTPTDALDTKFEFIGVQKKGGIPKSISFSGSSGPSREYVSPIDESTTGFKFAQSYASGMRGNDAVLSSIIKSFQGTIAYEYSKYTNNISQILVDNPGLSTPVALTYNTTTGAYTCPSTTFCGTNTGRVGVMPSNNANTMSAMGSVLLPLRTRVTGTVNVSTQEQNAALLPQFNNSAMTSATDPNIGLLDNARPSLQGKVRLTTAFVSATSHPLPNLSVGAKYRNESYSNQTPEFRIRAMAISDRQNALADSATTEWDPFTKVSTDVHAAYEFARGLSVGAGYAVDDMTRSAEDDQFYTNREKAPRFTVDYSALSWLDLHASYSTAQRRAAGGYALASTEYTGFRRYFVTDRDRKRMTAMATITPVADLSIGFSYVLNDDKYPDNVPTTESSVKYGLNSDKSTSTGVDVDWTPMARLSVGVGYSQEQGDAIALFRYRASTTVTNPGFDNPTYRWTTTNQDRNNIVSANLKAVLVPDKLEATLYYSVIDAKFHELNRNFSTPTGGATLANDTSAMVNDWPEQKNKLTPMTLAVQYKVNANWALNLRFNTEKYTNDNWQAQAPYFTTTKLGGGPALPGMNWGTTDLPGSIGTIGTSAAPNATGQYHFLGNNYHGYQATWFTFTVSWHPDRLPLVSGRSTL